MNEPKKISSGGTQKIPKTSVCVWVGSKNKNPSFFLFKFSKTQTFPLDPFQSIVLDTCIPIEYRNRILNIRDFKDIPTVINVCCYDLSIKMK